MENNPPNHNSNKTNQFVKGWTWGNVKLVEGRIEFENNEQQWFSIPNNSISNIQSTKTEIAIEFNIDEDTNEREEFLSEMRLYIPNKTNVEEEDNEEGKAEDKSSAAILKDLLSRHTNVGSVGDAIAHISEVQMTTPRGKFDLYFIKNHIKIRGPSANYKIPHKHVSKVFLLPKPDGHYVYFVVGLSTPIKQGNTSYPFLVFNLKNKNERTINLNLPEDEEERKEIVKNQNILDTYKGELIDIMAKLFQSLVGIGVIIPGKTYKSHNGTYAIKCSVKASEGYFYPLERSMVFVSKPVLSVNLEDVRHVEFTRVVEAPQRSFDMKIATRREELQFSGIDKVEYEHLVNYFTNKNIKINNKDERDNVVEMQQTVHKHF